MPTLRLSVKHLRLWSIHPKYLDAKGLVALWREALLAQKVLLGKTKGYKNHPQLVRFRKSKNPLGAIAVYLRKVALEAEKRGYNFDTTKIIDSKTNAKILVNSGQVEYEFKHLLRKLKERAPDIYKAEKEIHKIELHPLFKQVKGGIEEWEITNYK
jgi:hypothetical protein